MFTSVRPQHVSQTAPQNAPRSAPQIAPKRAESPPECAPQRAPKRASAPKNAKPWKTKHVEILRRGPTQGLDGSAGIDYGTPLGVTTMGNHLKHKMGDHLGTMGTHSGHRDQPLRMNPGRQCLGVKGLTSKLIASLGHMCTMLHAS